MREVLGNPSTPPHPGKYRGLREIEGGWDGFPITSHVLVE